MNVFRNVSGLRPGRSIFDLSYDKKLTCDMGQLIPIMCDEVIPGDIFKIANQIVIRFQPLVAPVLHQINVFVHYFFVPYRLLWDSWEDFISGGVDGDDTSVVPRWEVTNNAIGSLWDYMGFPTGVTPVGAYPLDFPRRAYNTIFNQYYRDETLTDEVDITNQAILYRSWLKDYFTSALPWQQRGTAPALPITGETSAEWPSTAFNQSAPSSMAGFSANAVEGLYVGADADQLQMAKNFFANNTVDLSTASTFDIADLRLAFQIQKWMERNARGGVRYTEFLRSHFGVSPRDDRLQRPEYIGGSKSPVIISEVLQTSSTDSTSAQGNLAGHGIVADQTYVAKYRAEEFGLIMGIMSVMPVPAYQQGIDRQWLRRTKYDFFFPEFANLSEQAIEEAEIYAQATEALNTAIFGYQGRFDELRVKRNQVCGLMRTDFNYWHMGRIFDSAPALNSAFVVSDPTKRIFAVPSEPGLIVDVGNQITALRPIPVASNPGLIDHN